MNNHQQTHRILLLLLFFIGVGFQTMMAQNEKKKPNVLFILADDLGINALNCFGNPLVESPNIDKLYKQGMHFTNGYSNDPTCAPSRASIMSGQYVTRHQVYRVVDRFKKDKTTLHAMKYLPPEIYSLKGSGEGLPLDKITLAEAFKNNGYVTAAYGKWHLGHHELGMTHQGFDEGVEMIGHYNFKTFPKQNNYKPSDYASDIVTKKITKFITASVAGKKPFFAYVPYYLVHKPLEPKPEYLKYFKEKLKNNPSIGSDEIKVLAMIKSLDENVGQLLNTLEDLGISDNTIVVFASDNGHYHTETNLFTQPYRGYKGQTYEGGIRVPYIFKWPGHIKQNSNSKEPIIHVDLYPTLINLTHSELSGNYVLDGEDLSPILLGKSSKTKRDALIWEYTNYSGYNPKKHTFRSEWVNVIQKDGFKLTEVVENGLYYMFNLNNDPFETKDIYQDYPKEAATLKARLEQWKKETGYQRPMQNPDYIGPGSRK